MHVLPIGVFCLAVSAIVIYSVLHQRPKPKNKDVVWKTGEGHYYDDGWSGRSDPNAPQYSEARKLAEEKLREIVAERTHFRAIKWVRLSAQLAISALVLGGALFIIISPIYDPKDKHWAYGSAGTILGFWL